jgi:hypothetical protein
LVGWQQNDHRDNCWGPVRAQSPFDGAGAPGIGDPDDVIVADTTVDDRVAVGDADSALGDGFASAVGWDPRLIGDDWTFLPPTVRVQAYRGTTSSRVVM